jgi:hypothetical protein
MIPLAIYFRAMTFQGQSTARIVSLAQELVLVLVLV